MKEKLTTCGMADLKSNDERLRELALFAGAGGGILGGKLLGWRTVCAVEWDAYAASVLVARQNDGCLEPFPIWDDVRTFDGKPWRGIVDVVSGGFPCQDISAAGRGAGIDGERSGLWGEMARIVSEVRPRYVFVENSPLLVKRGLTRVLGDLATMGYDARWGVVGAHHAGASHKRDRIWIVGKISYATSIGLEAQRASESTTGIARICKDVAHTENRWDVRWDGQLGVAKEEYDNRRSQTDGRGQWWATEPCVGGVADGVAAELDIHGAVACGGVGRVATGVPNRSGRIKAIGNGQVPAVAAMAWRILSGGLMETD